MCFNSEIKLIAGLFLSFLFMRLLHNFMLNPKQKKNGKLAKLFYWKDEMVEEREANLSFQNVRFSTSFLGGGCL